MPTNELAPEIVNALLARQGERMRKARAQRVDVPLPEFLGPLEFGAQLATGMSALALGAPYSIYKDITSRTPGDPYSGRAAGNQALADALEQMTYQPRTQTGQAIGQTVGKFMDEAKIPPYVGRMGAVTRIPGAVNLMAENAAMRDPLFGGSGGRQRGMFVGSTSRTWNPEMAAMAVKMEAAGAHPRDIWEATGTWRAPDKQWRQEISDQQMKLLRSTGMSGDRIPLSTMVSHPEYQKAYPDLFKRISGHTEVSPFWADNEGGFAASVREPTIKDKIATYIGKQSEYNRDRTSPRIMARGPDKANVKDTIGHELQHAVQYESTKKNVPMVGGSSPEKELNRRMAHANEQLERTGALPVDSNYSPQSLFDGYLRNMGEAEARATGKRRTMSNAQRRAEFPEDSYDVPLNELHRKAGGAVLKRNKIKLPDGYKRGGGASLI